MELYLKLVDVIAPVFFVIGIGYYLGKKNPEISTDFITTFAGNVGTPAMIFYTITTTGVTLAVFIEYFIYALIIITGFSLVGILFLLIFVWPGGETESLYGLDTNEYEHIRIVGPLCAIWYAVFIIPLFLFMNRIFFI